MTAYFYCIKICGFSVLTVDRASPLSVKRSWGRVGGCTCHFAKIVCTLAGSAMSADKRIEESTGMVGCKRVQSSSRGSPVALYQQLL
jgi:hypothetical protein